MGATEDGYGGYENCREVAEHHAFVAERALSSGLRDSELLHRQRHAERRALTERGLHRHLTAMQPGQL